MLIAGRKKRSGKVILYKLGKTIWREEILHVCLSNLSSSVLYIFYVSVIYCVLSASTFVFKHEIKTKKKKIINRFFPTTTRHNPAT